MSAQSPKLRVFLSGVPCGTITENAHGALSFSYDESYHGVPLSLSMPGAAPTAVCPLSSVRSAMT